MIPVEVVGWACGNRGTVRKNSPDTFYCTHAPLIPWGSPSHDSTGHCPYNPSLYLSKVWRPIAFSGWVLALMENELGPRAFFVKSRE